MQTIFDLIKEKVMQCEHEKCMFHIPAEVNYCVVRHEEIEPVGAVLTGDFWRLEKEDNWLEIRYVSKDKCRTFDIRPDRSSIEIRGKIPQDISYSYAWDEKW